MVIEPTSLACVCKGEDSEKQTFDFDRLRSQMVTDQNSVLERPLTVLFQKFKEIF
jgi:hypothetical protein